MPFPVDIKYVKQTEEKLGVRFPPAFVIRMVNMNGGSVAADRDHWQLYPIFDTSDRNRLKRTCNDVVRETELARDWPDFPDSAVAIGANGGGDQLVFVQGEEKRLSHKVYLWDHETIKLTTCADDFSELE